MHNQKPYYTQLIQTLIEPRPSSPAVGYVDARSSQDSINLALQIRGVAEFAEIKGWEHARWYEESERNEDTEQFPFFAQLLNDASTQFQEGFDAVRVPTFVRAVRRDRQESPTMRREGN